jgi:hypothetical protein
VSENNPNVRPRTANRETCVCCGSKPKWLPRIPLYSASLWYDAITLVSDRQPPHKIVNLIF